VGILGAAGQLGRCLAAQGAGLPGIEVVFAATREDLDLSDADASQAWLDARARESVDVVLNAGAFTKVDACESESDKAFAVNATAPSLWARWLNERGIRFVHVSTDYVFPGDGRVPYQEDDPTGPRSVYGASKLAGEEGVLAAAPDALVVRTSWVFGPGRNFVVAILDQAAKRRRGEVQGPLSVVDDQLGSPTFAGDLADALLTLAVGATPNLREASGRLHLCNQGQTSWYGFARQILDSSGYGDIAIDPVPTSAFPTPAPRPAYSVLDCSRAVSLGLSMRPWRAALSSYLAGPDRPPTVHSERVGNVTGRFPGHEGRA
jgi:dTDP-4-dehydrorhamnose reductase